jgi:acyl-CoA thioesterase
MVFDDDTTLSPAGDDAFQGELDPTWWTPRGPLGGYVMALMMRGMQMTVDDAARQPRSMTVHFLRPPHEGRVTVHATVERSGRSLSTVSARLEQGGEQMALALAAFSSPWESPLLDGTTMPDAEPAGPRVPAAGPGMEKAPPFTRRLTMQPRFGEPPFTRAEEALVGGWIGLIEERPVDALTILVLADAWYPAPWPRLGALAPAPTVEMTVHFRSPLPLADGLMLGRFRSRLVRDGFFDEDGELWTPEGTLVAGSRQLGLLLGAQA